MSNVCGLRQRPKPYREIKTKTHNKTKKKGEKCGDNNNNDKVNNSKRRYVSS